MLRRSLVVLAAVVIIAGVAAGILVWRGRGGGGGAGVLVDRRMEDLVSGAPQTLSVSVEGVSAEGWFQADYTCDGADRTPRVQVSGVPGGAKAVALIMYDPDAPMGTFIHWLAYQDAAPSVVFPSPEAVEGRNDFGRIGYGGPCPPRGHGSHRYFFLVVALDEKPGLAPGYRVSDLLRAARGHVIAWGYAMGKYSR